ncbi:MAG TPA: AAA family ATPase [Bryobacteraceae bacterium]|jgi:general secretion pathway protein A|nr:AAA family ATPase [Bryobacteraceae bacterium]
MYESHFGLSKTPFSLTPDPAMLYLPPSHREALAALSYTVRRQKGFMVLVGEAGTGKTTLLRKLMATVREAIGLSAVVSTPTLAPDEFLELVLVRLGMVDPPASKAARMLWLEGALIEANREKKIPVLVIDEAHKLSPSVLEEIRLLTNFETADHKLLQVILAGQPELNHLLDRADLWQFKQRVAVRVSLEPLAAHQVFTYISHRWQQAGGPLPLPFEQEAIELVVEACAGIPRIINSVCDNALLLAYGMRARRIERSTIAEVLRDLGLTPVVELPRALEPAAALDGPALAPHLPFEFRMFREGNESDLRSRFFARWVNRRRAATSE